MLIPVETYPEAITQRDLRTRSREIMDAVEHGRSFTVTRDGHRIGELIPLRRHRRFVSRQDVACWIPTDPGHLDDNRKAKSRLTNTE